MNSVEVINLRVDYDDFTAVHNISFTLEKGKIYGFVGPNGAGKTSTIKALAGIIELTEGTIILNGFNLEKDRNKALQRVGYMPDFSPVYENLKVWEYLDVFAAAYGMPHAGRRNHVDQWLTKIQLDVKANTYIKELSRGMRQRLVLAKMLEVSPEILLLDEPASGLDPLSRKQMRDLLKEASAQGATVLISSHILSELNELADSVVILEKGNLVVAGTLDEIRNKIGAIKRLEMVFSNEDDVKIYRQLLISENITADCVSIDRYKHIVQCKESDRQASDFLFKLLAQGVIFRECSIKNDNIEDVFYKIGVKGVV